MSVSYIGRAAPACCHRDLTGPAAAPPAGEVHHNRFAATSFREPIGTGQPHRDAARATDRTTVGTILGEKGVVAGRRIDSAAHLLRCRDLLRPITADSQTVKLSIVTRMDPVNRAGSR